MKKYLSLKNVLSLVYWAFSVFCTIQYFNIVLGWVNTKLSAIYSWPTVWGVLVGFGAIVFGTFLFLKWVFNKFGNSPPSK